MTIYFVVGFLAGAAAMLTGLIIGARAWTKRSTVEYIHEEEICRDCLYSMVSRDESPCHKCRNGSEYEEL